MSVHSTLAMLTFSAVALWSAGAVGASSSPARRAILEEAVEKAEPFWRRIADADPAPHDSCRRLLAYALNLCETGSHPERLERLFALAGRMQDRDPSSRHWGNLRWHWREAEVTDTNAVEFCMHDAAIMAIRNRDRLPQGARDELEKLVGLGIEGCLRHRVPADYTNIAVLNAANLIVLGERFERADAAEEGYRRLDGLCIWTANFGIHEFCSPTYYGIDLNGLLFLYAFAGQSRQRDQAAALLQLFWTDIAANWFPAGARLGGAHSRSYDYLRGLGALDCHLWTHGWFESQTPGAAERMEPLAGAWSPPRRLQEMSRERLPRRVVQRWGILPAQSRTHMIHSDIALSCSGASYGAQDMPLVVDLAGKREEPRCYFIADGREDPYGKNRYESGAAGHRKALHMTPFWAGAQRADDALGIVVYRDRDYAADEVSHVQSHFVLRRTMDALWIAGKPVTIAKPPPGETAAVPVAAGQPVVLRYGTAGIGLRVAWSGGAGASLMDEGNPHGCVRLTIDHGIKAPIGSPAGAAIWIRVGSGLASAEAFEQWRQRFESASCSADLAGDRIRIDVPGTDGPVRALVQAPFDDDARVHLTPEPCRGVLELDGKEVGRPLLTAVEPLRSNPAFLGPPKTQRVVAGKSASWEAETGLVLPGMRVLDEGRASGRASVGQPDDAKGQSGGNVTWTLQVEKAGRYWLWGRVRAPDPQRDSFSVGVMDEGGWLPPRGAWHLATTTDWQWQPLRLDRARTPTAFDLPAGACRLQFRAREPGAEIDRLLLTPDERERPPD